MKRTTIALMGTIALLLSACSTGTAPAQSQQTTAAAPSPTAAIPDYSSADLTKLLPTQDEVRQRMVSEWTSDHGPETTKYKEIPFLGLGKVDSGASAPGSSECRKGAAAGPDKKWTDGVGISGTTPAGDNFGIALLRFQTADDAAAYAARAKT